MTKRGILFPALQGPLSLDLAGIAFPFAQRFNGGFWNA